ncbi:hypothetical protein TrVFT333_003683 [Trichoderma virens FT-333]|nr:hypothetical protein TrVFT333_003683 [Trichoderma virens FT-333]
MDDPDISWPAWKFGLKRDDLFTTLHDQYNTISYPSKTPKPSTTTSTKSPSMRTRPKNSIASWRLGSGSGSPNSRSSDQWQHALQLFRTKSYDSIVRYFASYLPDDYLESHMASTSSSFSETDSIHTTSTKASSAGDASYFVDDDDDFFPHGSLMAEPCAMNAPDMPLSPESEGSPAESADSPTFTSTNPPSRSMSFSGSDSGRLSARFIRRSLIHDDDDASQSDDCDTTVTSVCDSAETRSSFDPSDVTDDVADGKEELPVHIVVDGDEDDDEFPTAQLPEDDFCTLDSFDTHNSFNNTNYDTLESDTPTPRQVTESSSYLDYKTPTPRKSSPSQQRPSYRRSPSPRSLLGRRREGSPSHDVRRSPEEALSKIQKQPLGESIRRRPKSGRRWQA